MKPPPRLSDAAALGSHRAPPTALKWRAALLVAVGLLLAGCLKSFLGITVSTPGTGGFLDSSDFQGDYTVRASPNGPWYGGASIYDGRLVFVNLPRTVVDDVLPSDLILAQNKNPSYPSVHPVLLLYGHQENTQWVFPWGSLPGQTYRELIVLIPFVQKSGGTRWHNYVVRIYLDNAVAEALGNQWYGYFKQLASFNEPSSGSTASVDVFRSYIKLFHWDATTSAAWVPHSAAVSTLENYADALEIMGMPLLGTFVDFGGTYSCSYWEWDMQAAMVRPTDVALSFLQPFRSTMTSWVGQGTLENEPKGAFEIQGVDWALRFPPIACDF